MLQVEIGTFANISMAYNWHRSSILHFDRWLNLDMNCIEGKNLMEKIKRVIYSYFQIIQHNTVISSCYISISKINSMYPSSICYNFCNQMLTVVAALPSTAQRYTKPLLTITVHSVHLLSLFLVGLKELMIWPGLLNSLKDTEDIGIDLQLFLGFLYFSCFVVSNCNC